MVEKRRGWLPEVRLTRALELAARVREDIIVPALTNALKDPVIQVRRSIESGLWSIGKLAGKKADVVIPVLVAQLDPTDPKEFGTVCVLLGTWRPEARSASPALSPRLADQDYGIRRAATNALVKIAPEAAAKDGVKRSPEG